MSLFAKRMDDVPKSFIREILKVTEDPEVISFAGGLPNPELFPVESMRKASDTVLKESGAAALQYSTTEGYAPLREWIAQKYQTSVGITVHADEILITSGSQQCLDLLGKIFINPGDHVLIERPGYLGSIQAFSLFEPKFTMTPLETDGPDLKALEETLKQGDVKFFYAVPNFQNPSGLTYSHEKRVAVAELLHRHNVLFVEDDPYGALRFEGQSHKPICRGYVHENAVLLGTFSKIAAPGFRLGWIVAPHEIREKLVVAKQAADLHTSTLAQRILHQYLVDNDIEEHIALIRERYGKQKQLMAQAIKEHFPSEAKATDPEGGMFLWVELPEQCSALELLDIAVKDKVAFVPGMPFYVDGGGGNCMRLNFSNANEEMIKDGIARLGASIKRYLANSTCKSQ